jgi:phosphatidylserine/phosphatidylglycerophosphate/cardiolipin synthase-like enzyme
MYNKIRVAKAQFIGKEADILSKTKVPFLIFLMIVLIVIPTMSGCNKIFSFSADEESNPVSNLPAGAIYINGAAIRPLTLNVINQAKQSIYIELSSLNDQEIIHLLITKARSGIEVRLLLDQWQRDNTSTIKTLKNENISVQYYPAEKGQFQRVRYMVIDHKTAVFYGSDWTTKGFNAHSMAVKLSGDSVGVMDKSFGKDWTYTTTLSLDLPDTYDLPEDNVTFAITVNVKQQLLNLINAAASEIRIETEQLSESDTIDALVEAKKRGCNVKVIVSLSSAITSPDAIQELKDAQIELRYYNQPDKKTMGANFGIFDQTTLFVSNSAWTYYSFVINHEGSLTVPSPAVAKKVTALFDEEWANSTP